MKKNAILFSCLLLFIFFMGCDAPAGKQSGADSRSWTSKNFNASAELGAGWTKHIGSDPGDSVDKPNELLVLFKNNGLDMTYLINIADAPQLRNLDNFDLMDAKKAQLQTNSQLRFSEFSEVDFAGRNFCRLLYHSFQPEGRFVVAYLLARGDGDRLITIQLMYPRPKEGFEPPSEIADFHAKVTLPYAANEQ